MTPSPNERSQSLQGHEPFPTIASGADRLVSSLSLSEGTPQWLRNSTYFASTVSEKTPLRKQQIPVDDILILRSVDENEKLRQYTLAVCIVSVILNIIMGVTSFVFAAMGSSSAMYGFAVDCILDVFSSGTCVWRYYGSRGAVYSHTREKVACICLGILFIVSALAVIAKSWLDLASDAVPSFSLVLFVLVGVNAFICFVLALAEVILGKKLKSQSLILDSIISVISGVQAMVVIFSDVAYQQNPMIWYLDPVFSIFLSLCMIVYGAKVIVWHSKHSETK